MQFRDNFAKHSFCNAIDTSEMYVNHNIIIEKNHIKQNLYENEILLNGPKFLVNSNKFWLNQMNY